MSNSYVRARALNAILIAPAFALLACASGGAKSTNVPDDPGAPPPSFDNGDARTLENMFAGRFPGVIVTPVDGGGLQFRIRGGSNSFNSSEQPLFVLDDSPIEVERGILFLNPYDIEKIEVLKNPADLTMYGVRGANGVIKITTKRPRR